MSDSESDRETDEGVTEIPTLLPQEEVLDRADLEGSKSEVQKMFESATSVGHSVRAEKQYLEEIYTVICCLIGAEMHLGEAMKCKPKYELEWTKYINYLNNNGQAILMNGIRLRNFAGKLAFFAILS